MQTDKKLIQTEFKIYLVIFFLLGIFFVQAVTSLKEKSLTSDEGVHLAAGYSYLKTGDYRMNIEHPPLMKMLNALPILFLNPSLPLEHFSWREAREWRFSEEFVYRNRIDADKLLFWGRIPTVLLAMFLGFFIFKWTKELYDSKSAIFALFLYVFCPNILAHSQLVTTDLAASCFIFLSIYSFWKLLREGNKFNLIFAGMSLGLALASKFTTVILFPIYFVIYFYFWFKNKVRKNFLRGFILVFFLAMLILIITYRFTSFENYFIGLKRIISEATSGHTSFLLGKYSNTGWWYYYLVAFLLKTPISIIVLLIFYFLLRKKLSLKDDYFLLIPIILIFLNASLSKKQIGLRYILPVYPFLFILLSSVVKYQTKKVLLKFVLIFLTGIWYLISSLRIYPHYLAYFNEFVGGPDNGWKYLADSNIDWGQDLKGLKKYLEEEGNPEILLGYFGSANPDYYKIEYQKLPFYVAVPRMSRKINLLNPQKELLAISVNILHSIYSPDRNLFDWLKKKKLIKKIGYSIFVYNVTTDIDAHENLAEFYLNNGYLNEAKREAERLLILQSDNPVAHFTLSCLYVIEGKEETALLEYEKVEKINPNFLPQRYYYFQEGNQGELYYRSLFTLAAIYFRKSNYERTIHLYEKIIKLYSDSADAYNNLGVVYEKMGKNEEARQSYQRTIQLRPDFADAYYNLGVLYWKKNEWDLVVKNFLEVLRINPNHQEAKKYLSFAQEKLNKSQ